MVEIIAVRIDNRNQDSQSTECKIALMAYCDSKAIKEKLTYDRCYINN